MTYTTLISAGQLHKQLYDQDWVVIDCRFNLADTDAGFKAYRLGHLPNAKYAHLDKDLSGRTADYTGRHPLPNITEFVLKLGAWGITNQTQVVIYDDAGGAFAARLWWLLRYLGHDKAAVLDGGIQAWRSLGLPITTTLPKVQPAVYRPYMNYDAVLTAIEVQNGLARKSICLIDARTPERFHGEQEPIDPVAGHIPGAVNRPFQLNLDSNGLFLPPEKLQQHFKALMQEKDPEHTVHMCGSGVTACHNLLALESAGLTGSKLYAGSWSEWIRNLNRPVAPNRE